MSKPVAESAPPIPTGILVSVSGLPSKTERPAPKRKVVPRVRARQVPWLWLVSGGSAAWALLILAIGLSTAAPERPQPSEPAPVLTPLAHVTPAPVDDYTILPKEIVPPEGVDPIAPPEPAPAPLPLFPAENMPEPPMEPGVPIAPEPPRVEEPNVPVEVEPVKPTLPKPPPPRKDVDLRLFASCEQIGTNILFMKDPPEAFKRARAEKKLVFMVHLSGNLEDKEFT